MNRLTEEEREKIEKEVEDLNLPEYTIERRNFLENLPYEDLYFMPHSFRDNYDVYENKELDFNDILDFNERLLINKLKREGNKE